MSDNKKQVPAIELRNPDLAILDQKKSEVDHALSALPEDLRQPIAEYVGHRIDLKLAPAPVTRTDYWAHVAMVAVFAALWGVYFEVKRRLTTNGADFLDTVQNASIVLAVAWICSVFSSIFLRIQTQSFRFTATFIASNSAFLGFVLVTHLSAIFYFYLRPWDFAAMTVATLYCAVGFYWAYWYAKRALPTTRKKLVKQVVVSVLGLLVVNLMILLSKGSKGSEDSDRPEYLPAIQVIPFAADSGSRADLSTVLDRHFKKK